MKLNQIVSVGRIAPDKNYEFMISCFKEIKRKDWGYVICGDGVESLKSSMICADGELENLSTVLKGYNCLFKDKSETIELPVFIKSGMKSEELKELLSHSKIFFHAKGYGKNQDKEPQEFEHFGMATAEAMAQGCVPVVFNGGGQKEIVEHGISGFLFNTKEEAIYYLDLLTGENSPINLMSQNAIESARRFDTKIFQSRIGKIVEGLKKSKRGIN